MMGMISKTSTIAIFLKMGTAALVCSAATAAFAMSEEEIRAETDSDFGFCLSCWDRIFGTYIAEPAKGQLGMVIGVEGYRADTEQRLDRLLLQPLKDDA